MFIVVPLLWYRFVNNYSVRKMLSKIQLRKEGMDLAALWGFLTVLVMFFILFIISLFFTFYGVSIDDSSNITDLEQVFTLPSIFIIIIFQPIGEEIFFRGFLFDKINAISGRKSALVVTSLLFGIAHLTYGNIYPAVITGVLGFLLAYMVVKTKNLITSIVAHILFNVFSITLYIIGNSFIP
jgi:membrane protease YdiL (CAAX protease family)